MNTVPDVSHMRAFGCDCNVHVPDTLRPSFSAKSIKCIFIGYDDTSLAYLCYFPTKRTITRSGHVIFNEDLSVTKDRNNSTWLTQQQQFSLDIAPFLGSTDTNVPNVDIIDVVDADLTPSPTITAEPSIANILQLITQTPPIIPSSIDANIEVPICSSNPLQQMYNKSNVPIERATLAFTSGRYYDPSLIRALPSATSNSTSSASQPVSSSSYSTTPFEGNCHPTYAVAMRSEEHKTYWLEATQAQIKSLLDLHCWSLVDHLPPGHTALDFKWVRRIKLDVFRFISSFKMRLTIKVFKQMEGVNFFNTFSPVVT
jgi:hypothetical protein